MENIKLKRKINYLEKIIEDKDHLYKKEHTSKEIIMQSEHSINQTNRQEKEKNTKNKDHKQSETNNTDNRRFHAEKHKPERTCEENQHDC